MEYNDLKGEVLQIVEQCCYSCQYYKSRKVAIEQLPKIYGRDFQRAVYLEMQDFYQDEIQNIDFDDDIVYMSEFITNNVHGPEIAIDRFRQSINIHFENVLAELIDEVLTIEPPAPERCGITEYKTIRDMKL